jgi:dTMP kinase
LPADRIVRLHALMFESLAPDLTLLLDLPVEAGLARARQQLTQGGRPLHESRFEDEAALFHQRVRAGYLELARQQPERIRVIDAAADEPRVQEDILRVVSRLFACSGADPIPKDT